MEDTEHEHAHWHEEMDGYVENCDQATYRRVARNLTAIPPHWPTLTEWKGTTLAKECPILNRAQTATTAQVNRLSELWFEEATPNSDWERKLEQHNAVGFLPEREFRAGALHKRYRMWERYCQLGRLARQEAEVVLDIIGQGVRLQWCDPTDEHKSKEPRHQKRVAGVRAQLRKAGYGQQEAQHMLTSTTVSPLVFPNLLGRPEDQSFAAEQVQKNVSCGALLPWPFPGTRPAVVLSLAVVTNSYGKRRLIVDGRPINLRQKRLPFKYETASDAVRMLANKSWAWTLDVKAGYHHVLLHPQEWTYVGIHFEGQFYVHAALPFGLSQAPERFTRIMAAVREPLVATGAAITGMVDDSLGAGTDEPSAAMTMGRQIEMMGLLGWTLNSAKSMTTPAQKVQYLGYELDTASRTISLPQAKLQRLEENLSAARRTTSEQLYRRVAGQVAAASLAFPFTGLMIRALAMEKEAPTTADFHSEDRVLHEQLIEFLLNHMQQLNGQPMDAPIRPAQTLVVDTSESATGAHMLDSNWEAAIPLNDAELKKQASGRWSSTQAEVTGIMKALLEGVRCRAIPDDGTGAVQVICDNKGAVSALTHMRGGKAVFPVVAQVHLTARKLGLVLSFTWQRRSTKEVVRADALSKHQDPTDWRLSQSIFESQVKQHAKIWVDKGFYPPNVDMMASHGAHQVQHYVSAVWDGVCVAQDAMVQNWNLWPRGVPADKRREKPCLFLFPPQAMLTNVLWKIKVERPSVWLVCSRYLRRIDERYVEQLPVRVQFPLKCRAVKHIVKPTASNPAYRTGEQWKTPLQVLLITWEQL